MRVLSDISNQALRLADRAASAWLERIGGETAGQRERAVLTRLVIGSSLALIAAPLALCAFVGPAVALPAGVAMVAAGFLFSAVGSVALARQAQAQLRAIAALSTPSAESFLMEVTPGLVLFVDKHGDVGAVGGRDRDDFLVWMKHPSGRGFFEQIHVLDRIHFLQALDRLRQGEPSATADLRLERPQLNPGSPQFSHLRLEMTGCFDETGDLSYAVCQLTDISREERLRRDAESRLADAESANQAKSRFLAAVSHELRTPLNAILGFSDVLLGEYFGRLADERQREYVTLVRDSGAHLLSVVNTMLDVSKIEAGRYELMLEPFEIGDPIRACEAMLALQARAKGVALTSRIQKHMPEVVADERAMKQILINLVGNAVKFTDAGGAVTVDAGMRDGILTLSVSDTGIGIAPEELQRLGQPFVQLQSDYTRRFEGTGLGLSLVKGLVALHGGDFSIASRPGEGTIVTMSFAADGSGALKAVADQMGPAEFPPRLKPAVPERNAAPRASGFSGAQGESETEEGRAHDGAQAKIA